ncbi:MAG: PKD domain-containing protein [Bacteroidales bacterium]
MAYQIVNLTADPAKLIARFATQNSQLKATSKRIRYRGVLSGDVSRTRFEWSFDDGSVDTLNLDPDYTYTTDSVYTVCLKVFNDLTNDSDQYCQQVRVGNVSVGFPQRRSSIQVTQHNGMVWLNYTFQQSERVHIDLLDMAGRKLRNIYAGFIPAGKQTFRFYCDKGAYVIQLRGNSHSATEKIIVF